jgi:crossover junction endodeoxyribonuclease RuvC
LPPAWSRARRAEPLWPTVFWRSIAASRRSSTRYQPAEVAVEETVVNKNALSSLKLGHARGVVLLAAANAGLPVTEYAAKHVKRALTGTGAQ